MSWAVTEQMIGGWLRLIVNWGTSYRQVDTTCPASRNTCEELFINICRSIFSHSLSGNRTYIVYFRNGWKCFVCLPQVIWSVTRSVGVWCLQITGSLSTTVNLCPYLSTLYLSLSSLFKHKKANDQPCNSLCSSIFLEKWLKNLQNISCMET